MQQRRRLRTIAVVDVEGDSGGEAFLPGRYALRKRMAAASALDLLLDPGSRIRRQVMIPEGLRAAAQELAAEIAVGGPLAVRSIRETMRGTLADRARAAMDRELGEQDRLRQTADFAEGIRASAQRRPPRFEAR